MATKAKRIRKIVIYKRSKFHTALSGDTLKSLVQKALQKFKTVGDRRMNVGDNEHAVYHVVGSSICEDKGFVFGVLMTYTPGTDPLYLVDDELAPNVLLEKMKPPATDDGKRREFLESLMYFGIIQDHLVLMQSQALKAPQIEAYLRWLLHSSEVLAGDNTFQLIDTPTPAVSAKMEKGGGVRSITIGGEVVPTSMFVEPAVDKDAPEQGDAGKKTTRTHQLAVVASTNADEDYGVLAALKKLLKPMEAAKIDFDKLAGSNIEMSVTLRYKRETTEGGHALMDTLGVALRHSEDVETELNLIEGGTIKGSELKLNGPIQVTSYDGQLSASEVYEEMRQWLLKKVSLEELPAS